MEEFLSDILGKMVFNLKVAFGDWRKQIKQSKVPGSGDAVFQPQRMRVAPLRVEKISVGGSGERKGGRVGGIEAVCKDLGFVRKELGNC